MRMMRNKKFEPDRFYELGGEYAFAHIICGSCVDDELTKSEDGTYTGEEIVSETQYTLMTDDDTEPYQCDICMKQNEAYDAEYGD